MEQHLTAGWADKPQQPHAPRTERLGLEQYTDDLTPHRNGKEQHSFEPTHRDGEHQRLSGRNNECESVDNCGPSDFSEWLIHPKSKYVIEHPTNFPHQQQQVAEQRVGIEPLKRNREWFDREFKLN